MNSYNKIKLLLIPIALLLCHVSGLAMVAQKPFLFSESIEATLKQATYSQLKELSEIEALGQGTANLTGLLLRKSLGAVPDYPGGIYHLTVTAEKPLPNALLFGNFPWLKNKAQALLHIQFLEPCQNCQITLPPMNTVIKGQNLAGSIVFVSKEAQSTTKLLFLDKQKEVKIRARGQVFAAFGSNFTVFSDSPTKTIGNLFKNPYQKFIAEHTNEEGQIINKDGHHKPAWPHQIAQLVSYAKAKEKGVKHMTFGAATGSGKTRTMEELAKMVHLNKKVLILTSRENLVSQFFSSFKADFPDLKVISTEQSKVSFLKFLPDAMKHNDVVIATLQGFQRNDVYKTPGFLKDIDIIMLDEAHNWLALERKQIIDYLKNYKEKSLELLLFTATPRRLSPHKDSKLLSVYELSDEGSGEPHIPAFDFKKAIDAKVNAPFQIAYVSNIQLAEHLEANGDDYNATRTGELLSNSQVHGVVFDIYALAKAERADGTSIAFIGKDAIAFCAGIEHATSLAAYLVAEARKNTDLAPLLASKKSAYEQRLRNYLKSFAGLEAPAELRTIWEAADLQGSAKRFDRWFASEKDLKNLADSFLKKYPYVFADAVHSGNKKLEMASVEANAKLVRNRFGGSTILCGADKLTEGYDNPSIEVGFMLKPIRKSNIRSEQSFGRLRRVDPNNPQKVAFAIEFIWDKRQLILSSTDLLGTMSYGLDQDLSIKTPENAAYILSSEQRLEGSVTKNTAKRKLSEFKPHEIKSSDVTEIKKTRMTPKENSTEQLIAQLEDLIARLQAKAKALLLFRIENPGAEEVEEEELGAMQGETKSVPQKSSEPLTPMKPSNDQTSFKEQAAVHNLCTGASEALLQIKYFFAAKNSTPKMSTSKIDALLPKSTASTTTSNTRDKEMLSKKELLENLVQKMNRALNASESYMTGCQIGDPVGEIRELLREIASTGRQFGGKDSLVSAKPRREPKEMVIDVPKPEIIVPEIIVPEIPSEKIAVNAPIYRLPTPTIEDRHDDEILSENWRGIYIYDGVYIFAEHGAEHGRYGNPLEGIANSGPLHFKFTNALSPARLAWIYHALLEKGDVLNRVEKLEFLVLGGDDRTGSIFFQLLKNCPLKKLIVDNRSPKKNSDRVVLLIKAVNEGSLSELERLGFFELKHTGSNELFTALQKLPNLKEILFLHYDNPNKRVLSIDFAGFLKLDFLQLGSVSPRISVRGILSDLWRCEIEGPSINFVRNNSQGSFSKAAHAGVISLIAKEHYKTSPDELLIISDIGLDVFERHHYYIFDDKNYKSAKFIVPIRSKRAILKFKKSFSKYNVRDVHEALEEKGVLDQVTEIHYAMDKQHNELSMLRPFFEDCPSLKSLTINKKNADRIVPYLYDAVHGGWLNKLEVLRLTILQGDEDYDLRFLQKLPKLKKLYLSLPSMKKLQLPDDMPALCLMRCQEYDTEKKSFISVNVNVNVDFPMTSWRIEKKEEYTDFYKIVPRASVSHDVGQMPAFGYQYAQPSVSLHDYDQSFRNPLPSMPYLTQPFSQQSYPVQQQSMFAPVQQEVSLSVLVLRHDNYWHQFQFLNLHSENFHVVLENSLLNKDLGAIIKLVDEYPNALANKRVSISVDKYSSLPLVLKYALIIKIEHLEIL